MVREKEVVREEQRIGNGSPRSRLTEQFGSVDTDEGTQ